LKDGLLEALNILYERVQEIGFVSKAPTVKTVIRTDGAGKHVFTEQTCLPREDRNEAPVPLTKRRGCPLCPLTKVERWPDQLGVVTEVDGQMFLVVPNPAPIFREHWVISSLDHKKMVSNIAKLVHLAKAMPGRWVVQNGPNAGATVPHLHFQSFKDEAGLFPIREADPVVLLQKTISGKKITIEKFEAPYSSYRIRTKEMTPAIVQALVLLQDHFLGLAKTNRLTYTAIYNQGKGEYEIFFTPRDSARETTLDHPDKIGYPQPLGCRVSEEGKEWDTAKFREFLEAIKLSPEIATRFEAKFEQLDSMRTSEVLPSA
jgi:hypothetical protein